MTDKTSTAPVMSLVEKILDNLEDRRGFDSAFDIDEDVMIELKNDLCEIIDSHLNAPTPDVVGNGTYTVPPGYRLQPISEYDAMCANVNGDTSPDVVGGDVVAAEDVINAFSDELYDVFVDCDGEITESAIRNALERSIKKAGKFPVADFEIEGGLLTQEQRNALVRDARRALAAQPKGDASNPAEQTKGEAVAHVIEAPYSGKSVCLHTDVPLGTRLYATPRQAVPDGWQPIETAPTTGRQMILLLTPSRWPQVAWSNTWWTSGFSVENKPTHWMPIAAAPSAGRMSCTPSAMQLSPSKPRSSSSPTSKPSM